MSEHVDVLIIGAGLSGIGAGCHLETKCPSRSYAILERRQDLGGTWSLFQYPGIRSDSDMYTLGYSFSPWKDPKSIADGPSILNYVRDTAEHYGVDRKIRYGFQAKRAFWSSSESRWTVEAECVESGEVQRFSCNFIFMCTGYYNYDAGYTPDFEGIERFEGPIVHPQKWTEDIDYAGKRVVVIGSGATAVTLVPELAKQASHVTMLQRSPTYMVSAPSVDRMAKWLRKWLPLKATYEIVRWRNIVFGLGFFNFCRRRPKVAKKLLLKGIEKQLGSDYDIQTHFNPRYNPWEQRMCLVPDSDFFDSIKAGSSSVVTDEIETFTEKGLKLVSGAELPADLIVTATGLNLQFFSDLEITVDGARMDLSQAMAYKGMMFTDIPNLASAFGYTNASWTLKCDLTCEYVVRLLNHMEKKGYTQCRPHLTDSTVGEEPMLDFNSGYIQRSVHKFPNQGTKDPWRLHQNYLLDNMAIRLRQIEDPQLEFMGPDLQPEQEAAPDVA